MMKKTKNNNLPKTIEEDLESIREEDLLREERKKLSPRTKKLIIGFSGLLLILLFLSFIYLQYPLINIIEGQIESRSANNNILQLNDFRIIFTDDAMNFVKISYENNRDVETSLCLEGVKNGNDYFINTAYTPKIYEQSYRHVTSEPCSKNTMIIFHTHPYKSCLASGTDINTLKSTQKNRPDTIMVIMCEPNRFSTYK